MPTVDPDRDEPRRFSIRLPRPLWIGLAGVLLIMLATALRFGVSGDQRRGAVRGIARFNGSTQYLHRRGPNWLLEWLNDDRMQWLRDPDHLVFWPGEENLRRRSRTGGLIVPTVGPLIDDDILKCVLGLPGLNSLDLAFSSVSDAGVKHLDGLRKLENLRLEGSDVSNESIPILSQMKSLKTLNVQHTKISSSGARAL